MAANPNEPGHPTDDAPPFGRRWSTLYVAVVVILGAYIAGFSLVTRLFS